MSAVKPNQIFGNWNWCCSTKIFNKKCDAASAPVTRDVTAAPVTRDVTAATVTRDVTAAPVTRDVTSAPVSRDVPAAPVTRDVTAARDVTERDQRFGELLNVCWGMQDYAWVCRGRGGEWIIGAGLGKIW